MNDVPTPTVFLHIGLPKTGTTYLQHVLGGQRSQLRDLGILYPGSTDNHFLAVQDVMGHRFRDHLDPRSEGAWSAIMTEIDGWTENILISHELLSLADDDQVAKVVQALAEHDIRVIVTARDLARQLPAVWQEDLKNGSSATLESFIDSARDEWETGSAEIGFWRFQNVAAILQRWQRVVGGDRVALVTVPPKGAPRELLLDRFSESLGTRITEPEDESGTDNVSLGAAEAEFLRRLNEEVYNDLAWPEYRQYVKHFLVRRALGRGPSTPIRLSPTQSQWAAETSRQVLEQISVEPSNITGDLSDLVSPTTTDEAPGVDEEAVTEMGVRSIATLLRRIAREGNPTDATPHRIGRAS
jgi:hypothetical protein